VDWFCYSFEKSKHLFLKLKSFLEMVILLCYF